MIKINIHGIFTKEEVETMLFLIEKGDKLGDNWEVV